MVGVLAAFLFLPSYPYLSHPNGICMSEKSVLTVLGRLQRLPGLPPPQLCAHPGTCCRASRRKQAIPFFGTPN